MHAIELASVVKDYGGLRPLRIAELVVADGEVVAIGGVDLPSTEVFTGLLTGAVLPDRGIVRVFGQDTTTIADADAWLATLDRLGIVSDRVALLDGFTVQQNIAMPLSLDLDPMPERVAAAVRDLASEVRLPAEALPMAAAALSPVMRFRVRLARAIALAPRALLLEHPTASLPGGEVPSVAADLGRLLRSRHLTAIIFTLDDTFARIATRRLVFNPADGVLRRRGLMSWFSQHF